MLVMTPVCFKSIEEGWIGGWIMVFEGIWTRLFSALKLWP